MPCPTCSHTIQRLTSQCEHKAGWFWCQRCGTLAKQDCFFAAHVPALVGRAVKLCEAVREDLDVEDLNARALRPLERAVRESCTGRPDP